MGSWPIPAPDQHKGCLLGPPALRDWHHAEARLIHAAQAPGSVKKIFSGAVEFEETFCGGLQSNKHPSKKLRAGRGTVGKMAGAKDSDSGQVVARMVDEVNSKTMRGFVVEHMLDGASIYTDDSKVYAVLPFDREAVRHSIGEYVCEMAPHTNGIESFWALLKRGYQGIYHKMSSNHLGRCVMEFARPPQNPQQRHARTDADSRPGHGGQAAEMHRSGQMQRTA